MDLQNDLQKKHCGYMGKFGHIKKIFSRRITDHGKSIGYQGLGKKEICLLQAAIGKK